MLVLVGLVLSGFAAFIVQLNRRARMLADDTGAPERAHYVHKGTV
jgi:hypothetical protein